MNPANICNAKRLLLTFPLWALPLSAATLDSSRVVSTSAMAFVISDLPPSITDASTFTVTANGTPAAWQVAGGDGTNNGSITTQTLVVPDTGDVILTLKHRYNFEGDGTAPNAWDGGVVQYSINGGLFTILQNSNFTQNGYFALPLIGNHVLKDQLAFNGPSPGLASGAVTTSIATIPGLSAGDELEIRFLGAWDEFYTPDGPDWEISGVKVTATGGAVLMDQDFSGGDGGFGSEATVDFATWSFLPGTPPPSLGALTRSKTGGTLTLTQAIQWVPGSTYTFNITGQDSEGGPLVFAAAVTTPPLPLGTARPWPASIPGPLGTAGAWGVRTFLNEGLNGAEDLTAALDFLAASAERTPELSPATVVDTTEPFLNFVDPTTNILTGVWGILTDYRPFPGDALSTSTNFGTARDDNHVVTSAHGSVQITEESDYTFNFHGDDGFMFRIKAASGPHPKFAAVGGAGSVDPVQQNVLYFPAGTGDHNTRGIVHLTPGTYKLEYVMWEGTGGFFYQVSAARGFFVNDAETTTWRGVGYQAQPYPSMTGDWTVLSTLPEGVTQFSLPGADAAVDAAVAADAIAATSYWPQINFHDPESGGTGRIPNNAPWPRNTIADDNNYAMRMSGTLHIPETGNYLIGFQGDDGSRLTVGGVHGGFTALVENATGAGVIGRSSLVIADSGSVGASSDSLTTATVGEPGALAGDAGNTAVSMPAIAGNKITVPWVAGLNPVGPGGEAAPFSVEAWVKPATGTGTQAVVNSMIAGANQNPGNANDRSGYVLRYNNTDWQFYLGAENVYCIVLHAGATVDVGQWQHIAATWDGTTARLYKNGSEIAFGAIGGGTQPGGPLVQDPNGIPRANYAAPLYIGKRGFGDWLLDGAVDEVAIYGTTLDIGVINSHVDNGNDPDRLQSYSSLVLESSPLAYYRLNDTAQPRIDLGSIYTDVPTGDSSTVGRIFLTAGDYPVSASFWENAGGSSFEIFAKPDTADLGFRGLGPSTDFPGLPLVVHPTPAPAPPTSGLVILPGGALSVTFASVPYATYTLQWSLDLANWLDINRTIEASPTGSSTTYTGIVDESFFISPTDRRGYYRIVPNP